MYKVTVKTITASREHFVKECKFEPTWLHLIGTDRTTVYSMNAVDHVDIEVIPEFVTVKHVKPSSQLSTQPGMQVNKATKEKKMFVDRDDKEDRYSTKPDWQKP